jgi:hypothetical protein
MQDSERSLLVEFKVVLGVDDFSVFLCEFALFADNVADVMFDFLNFGFFKLHRNVILVGELEVFDLNEFSGVVDDLLKGEGDLLVGVGNACELGFDGLLEVLGQF